MIESPATEHEFELSAPAARDPWELELERLRTRFPGATAGTLFCVHKLELDPELTLRDFRDEASLRNIPLSGRSVHSAKVLLGREAPATRRKQAKVAVSEPAAPPIVRSPRRSLARATDETDSLEATLLNAVQQLQAEANAESRRLQEAIRDAIAVLQAALRGDDD